jgi:hypothetical protein
MISGDGLFAMYGAVSNISQKVIACLRDSLIRSILGVGRLGLCLSQGREASFPV